MKHGSHKCGRSLNLQVKEVGVKLMPQAADGFAEISCKPCLSHLESFYKQCISFCWICHRFTIRMHYVLRFSSLSSWKSESWLRHQGPFQSKHSFSIRFAYQITIFVIELVRLSPRPSLERQCVIKMSNKFEPQEETVNQPTGIGKDTRQERKRLLQKLKLQRDFILIDDSAGQQNLTKHFAEMKLLSQSVKKQKCIWWRMGRTLVKQSVQHFSKIPNCQGLMTFFRNRFHSVQQVCLLSKTRYQKTGFSNAEFRLTTPPIWAPRALYNVCHSTGLYGRQNTSCLRNLRHRRREVLNGVRLSSRGPGRSCPDECNFGISRVYMGLLHRKDGQLCGGLISPNAPCGSEASGIFSAAMLCRRVWLPQRACRKARGATFAPPRIVGRAVFVHVQLISRGASSVLWRLSVSLELNFPHWEQ